MKTQNVVTVAILFALITLSACSTVSTFPARHTSSSDFSVQARAMMEQYSLAILKMDARMIASFYLPDGAAYDNGKLQAQGPDAILTLMKSFDGVVRVDKYQTTITSVHVGGDTAIVAGTFQQQYSIIANNKTGTSAGKFTAEWIRQADKSWLIRKLETWE